MINFYKYHLTLVGYSLFHSDNAQTQSKDFVYPMIASFMGINTYLESSLKFYNVWMAIKLLEDVFFSIHALSFVEFQNVLLIKCFYS